MLLIAYCSSLAVARKMPDPHCGIRQYHTQEGMYEAASEETLSVELGYVRRWWELGPVL
jgi:hypothetical protein